VVFAVALGRGLRCGKLTVAYACLWPVTDIFQLKIRYSKVQSCFVSVRYDSYFL